MIEPIIGHCPTCLKEKATFISRFGYHSRQQISSDLFNSAFITARKGEGSVGFTPSVLGSSFAESGTSSYNCPGIFLGLGLAGREKGYDLLLPLQRQLTTGIFFIFAEGIFYFLEHGMPRLA